MESLKSQCEQVIKKIISERAEAAFNELRTFKSPDELVEGLEMCESLFMELKYVKSDI